MRTDDLHEEVRRPEPPLWSIGAAVVLILLAPVLLYSLAPTGPLREGDTVFSQGEQRVVRSGVMMSEPGETCLLDPDNPLIIIHRANNGSTEALLAQVQGNPIAEWPFCPPHAEVLVQPDQIYQKPELLRWTKGKLTRTFNW